MENGSAWTSKIHRHSEIDKVKSLILKGINLAFTNVQIEYVWKTTTQRRVVSWWKIVSGLKNWRYNDINTLKANLVAPKYYSQELNIDFEII